MPAPGHHVRQRLPAARRAGLDVAGYAIGGALAGVAAVRRGKAVHPHGAVYRARLSIDGGPPAPEGATFLREPAEHPALVRFSRSIGLPRPLPDLLGMSIRVPHAHGRDRHQDLLLVTSADLPVVHHVFLPATDVQQRPYTASLPFRAGDERVLVGALPRPDSPRPLGGTELERLRAAAATGRLRFDLAVARTWGRFWRVGELRVGEPMPDEMDALRFDPFNTGGGLEPAGALNALRDYACPLSQAAWRRTRGGAAGRQDEAGRQASGPAARDLGAHPASSSHERSFGG